MSLIVEDGTGRADAESLASVAEASAYLAARGHASWAALTDAAKESALRNASDYMGAVYRLNWAGYRINSTQALDWPRYYVPMVDAVGGYGPVPVYYDPASVPEIVKRACIELALKASTGTLLADQSQRKKSVKVGPIETEYFEHSPQAKRYPLVDNMLAPLFKASGNCIAMVRT